MNNILKIQNLRNICTGCRVCQHSCPVKCIEFKEDREGFIYPYVKEDECIGCGNCINKCHANNENSNLEVKEIQGYCAWNTNDVRLCSSSGGVFSAIVDSAKDSCVVYGAAFSEDWKSVHHIECSKKDYVALRKSKYVFSDLENVFFKIKKNLEDGIDVIFSGTPCQVSALKMYLRKSYTNLITVDVLCHGVPSSKIYQQHISHIAKKRDVVLVDFRPKGYGWNACLKVCFDNGEVYFKDQDHDWYLYNYFHKLTLRKSCYYCKYRTSNHQSDITIGDFWGVNRYKPEYLKEPGVGLIIANTEKGKEIVENLKLTHKEELDSRYYSYAFNKRLEQYDNSRRQSFFEAFEVMGISKLEKLHLIRKMPIDFLVSIKRKILKNTKRG